MQFYDLVGDVPPDFGPSAVTIGKFDGVHVGHRAVIDMLEGVARDEGLVSTVVTFDRHPLAVLRPDDVPTALVSNRQKRGLLDEAGVAATLMLTFDAELRALTPDEFVDRILVGALHARVVFVGDDFRFGVRGSGTVDLLIALGARHGFEVVVMDDVAPGGDRRVSSTWVREALAAGDVTRAAQLLGAPPTIRAEVVHGFQRGRTLG